jgi:hypothetical protein
MLDRARILLSTQRALLGAVTCRVRIVDVSWSDSIITLRFVLDSTDDSFDEITNNVEAEIEADFLPDASVTSEVLIAPTGTTVKPFTKHAGGNARVFARRET